MKAHRLIWNQRNIAEPSGHRWTDHRAEPAGVDQLFAAMDPRILAMVLRGCRQQVGRGPRLRVQPTESPLAALIPRQPQHVVVRRHDAITNVDLAMISGDQERCARRQNCKKVGDNSIGGAQLSIVELAEAAFVGDLVDAVVVRVHQAISTTKMVTDDQRQTRRNPPPDLFRSAQVCFREGRRLEFGLTDDRDPLTHERLERLRRRWRELSTQVAAITVPPQYVDHLAREFHSVANQPMLPRCEPGGDRRQRAAGRGGGDCRNRAALHRRQRRGDRPAFLQLFPAEPIQDQQHHLTGRSDTCREPRRQPGLRPRSHRCEQRWQNPAHVGAAVVGKGWCWDHKLTSQLGHYDDRVRVSSKGDYACRALLSLALHDEQTAPTSVRDIAERTALPQPYLEQILLALKGAGLVRSKRGVGGGYVLARPPDQIRISEILSAVDGPITMGDFGEPHQDGACDHEGQCVLLAIWKAAGEHMRQILDGFTLQTVADAARGVAPWPSALADAGLAPLR